MARSGARWRDLPERFGRYERTKQRYYRWIRMADEPEAMLPRFVELAMEIGGGVSEGLSLFEGDADVP